MENIRAKIKRRFSHKDKEVNFDDADSADEETNDYVNKEYQAAENDDNNPYGKPGSLLNKMILHGNKKTEDEIAAGGSQAEAARNAQTTAADTTTTTRTS